jgi:hypothetical protein
VDARDRRAALDTAVDQAGIRRAGIVGIVEAVAVRIRVGRARALAALVAVRDTVVVCVRVGVVRICPVSETVVVVV